MGPERGIRPRLRGEGGVTGAASGNGEGTAVCRGGHLPAGGSGRVTAFGQSTMYPTNEPVIYWNYLSKYAATPTGTAQLTRYNAEQGLAVGTFAFDATWTTGALVGPPATTASVTNGEFDIPL